MAVTETRAETLHGYRVRVRAPSEQQERVDIFELRQAAVECARLSESQGLRVIECSALYRAHADGESADIVTPIDWRRD